MEEVRVGIEVPYNGDNEITAINFILKALENIPTERVINIFKFMLTRAEYKLQNYKK